MGYSFRLIGASNLEIVSDVATEVRKELYQFHGRSGISTHGSVLYFDLRHNEFYVQSKNSLTAGFAYDGSWTIGTVETFFRELEEYAYENGLSYTLPIGMTSGMLTAGHCNLFSAELQKIKELALTKAPEWSEHMYMSWLEELSKALDRGAEGGALFWECH